MVSHGKKTQYGRMRQTNIAARETIHVSKNVTNITQTLLTCISEEPEHTNSVTIPVSISKGGCLDSFCQVPQALKCNGNLTLLYIAATKTVPVMRSQFIIGTYSCP